MPDHMKDAFDVHVEEEAVAIRPAIVTRQSVMKSSWEVTVELSMSTAFHLLGSGKEPAASMVARVRR